MPPTGGSTSGMPPSPVSSILSLSQALSSDPHMAGCGTPALSSRAGTPPPGPTAAGVAGYGGAGAVAAAGSFSRRVTSDWSLRS